MDLCRRSAEVWHCLTAAVDRQRFTEVWNERTPHQSAWRCGARDIQACAVACSWLAALFRSLGGNSRVEFRMNVSSDAT